MQAARGSANLGAYAMIVVTNLVVVLGVLLWNWSAREVLLLYGVEILAAGAFAALRIAAAEPSGVIGVPYMGWGGKLFCMGVSIALWAPFLYVYLLGLAALYPYDPAREGSLPHLIAVGAADPFLLVGLAAFLLQHAWLFFDRYLVGEAYRGASVAELVIDPLRRVVVTQVFVIAALAYSVVENTTALLIVPFILIRTGFELYLEGRDGHGNPTSPE